MSFALFPCFEMNFSATVCPVCFLRPLYTYFTSFQEQGAGGEKQRRKGEGGGDGVTIDTRSSKLLCRRGEKPCENDCAIRSALSSQ